MNKRKIIFIAFLMGIALVGLVVLQVNWIRHDFALRQQKFAQQATEAVNNAVDKIENRESVEIITTEMDGILDDSLTDYFRSNPIPEIPVPPELPEVIVDIDSIKLPRSYTFVSDYDTTGGKNKMVIVTSTNGVDEQVTVSVNSSLNEAVIAGNAKAELEKARIESSKAKTKARSYNELARQQFQLKKEREIVNLRMKRFSNVIEKMAVEYESRDVNLMERLSPQTIDSLVGSELKNRGIYLPYSIELTSGRNDSVLWKRIEPNQSSDADESVKVKLFPRDLINRNDSVKITFSDTIQHFISSMWMMLLSSVVFTGIVIFAFSYTVMVIFRQKKLSEIKNDFINNMTHEFKTPIATIRLASEAIGNPEVLHDAAKIKYYTGIIKDENERMNSHVENILQIAQFDKNSFAPELEIVNMHDVINDAVLMMKLHAEQKKGEIIFKPNASQFNVMADRRYIPLTILNLLDNAIKYTEKIPFIEVATRNVENQLIISVTDNGIGMSSDKQKKVFDKFYRVTTGNLHNVKGFGLGLSYVKAIVTAHEGEISVQSEPDKGSCFVIRLPLAIDRNNI